jgi:hypothetical protein
MKLLTGLLILSMVIPQYGIAGECQKPVTLLEEGASAPCRGYLFTPPKELEVRIQNEENKLLNKEIEFKDLKIDKLNKSLLESDKIIELEQQKAELWRARAEDSTRKLVESEDGRGRRDFWMVVLGVALTVGAGYAVGQAAR